MPRVVRYFGELNKSRWRTLDKFIPKVLQEEIYDGEPNYDGTIKLNKELVDNDVLQGRKASSSEKELQAFAARFAALGNVFSL